MAYTPVPSVAVNDWIDEIFINTYWVNNMAAMAPDVFSAKGQMSIGTGVDAMGVLSVGSNNKVLMADATQSVGVKWDWNVVVFGGNVSNSAWEGDNKSIGTTTIAANNFNVSLPNTARALFVTLSARWTTASDGNFVNIRPGGASSGNGVLVRSQVANVFQDNAGVVPLNASGEFAIKVSGAAADVYIDIWGYIL